MLTNHLIRENYIPLTFDLEQKDTNPLTGRTIIRYQIPFKTNVIFIVFNSYGCIIEKTVTKDHEPGVYELELSLDELQAGTYFYQIITDRYTETRSMDLLKAN